MADSGSGVKQFTGEMGQATSEVAKDVKDEVGQMIEQGVQSIAGKQLTPQQIQQKQQAEQQRLEQARKVINYYKTLDINIKKAQEDRKQTEAQRWQQMQQEEQAKKVQKAQLQQAPKRPGELREDIARTQAERGKGRGVGG